MIKQGNDIIAISKQINLHGHRQKVQLAAVLANSSFAYKRAQYY
jgi:hypothetical protein